MSRSFWAAALAWLALAPGLAAEPLTLSVRRITEFGPALQGGSNVALRFLGGLDLSSSDPRFGGLSGLDITQAGATALFISDTGRFVRARVLHENGILSGLADAEIGDIFPGGDPTKFTGDVEDVALDPADPSRGVLVIERQVEALRTFRWKDGAPGGFAPVPLEADRRILRSNRGLESVAYGAPTSPLAERVVVIAERPYRNRGDTIPGWIVGRGSFSIVRHEAYDISSARFLPGGDLMILERRFSPAFGIAFRLRRIAGAAVKPGAVLDGDVLVDAGMRSQVDNMEGLAVHTDAEGRTIVTVVSDDNFSILQRTLVLQFALSDAPAPAIQ